MPPYASFFGAGLCRRVTRLAELLALKNIFNNAVPMSYSCPLRPLMSRQAIYVSFRQWQP